MEKSRRPAAWELNCAMRRFLLDRKEDVSGISGVGVVAEGVQFTDGTTVLRWTVGPRSTAIYNSVEDLIEIHGHDGKTLLCWMDNGNGAAGELRGAGETERQQTDDANSHLAVATASPMSHNGPALRRSS